MGVARNTGMGVGRPFDPEPAGMMFMMFPCSARVNTN